MGPNGTGKTTLIRLIAGDLPGQDGTIVRSGGLGIMRQFIGQVRDDKTVRDPRQAFMAAAEPVRRAAAEIDRAELAMMEATRRPTRWPTPPGAHRLGRCRRLRARDALGRVHHGRARRAGGEGAVAQGHHPLRRRAEAACPRSAASRTGGGAHPRRAGQLSRRAGKRWLEEALVASPKTVLFINHDRELLSRAATRIRHPGTQSGADLGTGILRPTSRLAASATNGSRSCCAALGGGRRS
ncbi:MAG: ATP-binding cassette domain-containing protein [Dermatophilaceae bacterium]